MKRKILLVAICTLISATIFGQKKAENCDTLYYHTLSYENKRVANFRYQVPIFHNINADLLKDIYKPFSPTNNLDDFSEESLSEAIKSNFKFVSNWLESQRNNHIYYTYHMQGKALYHYAYMNIFEKQNNLLTLKYERYSYPFGIPDTTVHYRVFDLQENKPILNTDIFKDIENDGLIEILIQKIAKQHNTDADTIKNKILTACKRLRHSHLCQERLSENFYFNNKTITFRYNKSVFDGKTHYYIRVPFSELKDYLKPEFVEKLKKNRKKKSNSKVVRLTGCAATMPKSALSKEITTDEGVIINGIIWATRNVEIPGKFAVRQSDNGMFYKWNYKQNFFIFESNWSDTIPVGNTWEEANNPCPNGWRVPTDKEIKDLLDEGKVFREWTIVNGVKGIRFTDKTNDNSIFLRAAGYRDTSNGAQKNGVTGLYWSSTEADKEDAYCLQFGEFGANLEQYIRSSGFNVRCVAE